MLTKEGVEGLSYTDFIGLVNQWNVLPGAFDTINRWRIFADVTSASRVLEIACTTGFSIRELAVLTGCVGDAVDISAASVEKAIENNRLYAPDAKIDYHCADAMQFIGRPPYTHIIVGAGLRFLPDPSGMIRRCSEILVEGGYILASPFYIHTPVPQSLVDEAKSVFGITITTEPYKEVMSLYKDFELLHEDRKNLVPETDDELNMYCKSTIDRFAQRFPEATPEIQELAYKRLMEIKVMSNKLRPYQAYSVLVLRYRAKCYQRRFVELF